MSGKLMSINMNREQPGFSVIIPTYNRGYILEKAIRSVYNQQGKIDSEIIIVDDGSTDNTKEIVDNITDRRIRYFSQLNQGPSSARNLGLKHATKEWIVYLDSDNTLYPNYFEVISRAINDHPTMFYTMVRASKIYELYENGQVIKTKEDQDNQLQKVTVQDLFYQEAFFDVNGFLHKREMENVIKWDNNLKRLEDWDFFMQIGTVYPDNFLYIPQPLVDYRMRFGTDGILSNTTYAQWAEAFEYVYQKHKSDMLLQGQQWYPSRVEYYKQKQIYFEEGRVPPPYLRIFYRD